jgi:hypothetical protein
MRVSRAQSVVVSAFKMQQAGVELAKLQAINVVNLEIWNRLTSSAAVHTQAESSVTNPYQWGQQNHLSGYANLPQNTRYEVGTLSFLPI